MKNICITGGAGYIGTQLCKLYKNTKDNITVIDNRFLPERVKQLKEWNIRYIQGDILDEQLMKDVLKDTDFCYHLAGITDVARVSSESNDELDRRIVITEVEGSKMVIDNTPDNCKILFPSTHVIFEGLKEIIFDVKEDFEPCPVLYYSKSKYDIEKYLKKSNKNYIICRLSSNYGYGGDSMRLNIMPNMFAKMTAQNKTLKLFSGGIQWKSLVDLRDVVRSMKFLMENDDYKREIFNISNENITIKEVADLCKKIKPSVEIIETNDAIPNKGYTMSSLKLLDTGFKFKHNLESSLKEMINYWDFDRIGLDQMWDTFGGFPMSPESER